MKGPEMYKMEVNGQGVHIYENGKLILSAKGTNLDELAMRRFLDAANGNAEANLKTSKFLRDFGPKGDTNL